MPSFHTDPNLKDAIEILSRRNLRFWVNEGSLLGLIRDGELIEWDHDIDISLFSPGPNFVSLRGDFEKLGFEAQFAGLRRPGEAPIKFSRSGGRKIDLGVYELRSFGNREYWTHEWFATDKFRPETTFSRIGVLVLRVIHRLGYSSRVGLMKRLGLGTLLAPLFVHLHSFLSRAWSLDATVGYFIERSLLEDMVVFSYGDILCPVPRKAEQVLEALYGQDWRIPKKSLRWTDFLSFPPGKRV